MSLDTISKHVEGERARYDVEWHHRAMISDLREIEKRAQRLLAELEGDDEGAAWGAVLSIADSAGASGPIHSKYGAVIAHAATILGMVAGAKGVRA